MIDRTGSRTERTPTARGPAKAGSRGRRYLACALVGLALTAKPAYPAGSLGVQEDQGGPAQLPALALRGAPADRSNLRAWVDQPMLLNVWATWCAPCRHEMPALQKLGERLAPHGVRVLALSVDRDLNLVKEFLIKQQLSLPTAVVESPSDAFQELDAVALPLSLFVERGGRVVGRVLGPRQWDEEPAFQEVLDRLAPGGGHTGGDGSPGPQR